jgi:hypothetical protein
MQMMIPVTPSGTQRLIYINKLLAEGWRVVMISPTSSAFATGANVGLAKFPATAMVVLENEKATEHPLLKGLDLPPDE